MVGLFSLLTGLLIVAFTWGTLKGWRAALLAGYAWDSNPPEADENLSTTTTRGGSAHTDS